MLPVYNQRLFSRFQVIGPTQCRLNDLPFKYHFLFFLLKIFCSIPWSRSDVFFSGYFSNRATLILVVKNRICYKSRDLSDGTPKRRMHERGETGARPVQIKISPPPPFLASLETGNGSNNSGHLG